MSYQTAHFLEEIIPRSKIPKISDFVSFRSALLFHSRPQWSFHVSSLLLCFTPHAREVGYDTLPRRPQLYVSAKEPTSLLRHGSIFGQLSSHSSFLLLISRLSVHLHLMPFKDKHSSSACCETTRNREALEPAATSTFIHST